MKRVEKLSGNQVTELREVIRDTKSASVNVRRAQAILLLNNNCDAISLKMVTGYGTSFVHKLRKRYLQKGLPGFLIKQKKLKPLLTKTQLVEIQKIIQGKLPNELGIEADFWNTAILALLIKRDYGVEYKSKTSYHLIFKKAHFSYHKPDKQYHERDQKTVDAWYEKIVPLIQQEMEKTESVVLSGDEMILTTQTTTQKIWLPTGKSVRIEVSNKREKRCIYGFLNVKTGQEHSFKTDYTNSLTTCSILDELRNLYPNKKIVIVWDNASWHKSCVVRDFLEKNPDTFHLFSFPPYYPDANPQEHVWKAGRTKVSHNVFIENIDRATDQFIGYLNQTNFDYKFL